MIKKLKRNQGSDYLLTDMGITIPAAGELIIEASQYTLMARSNDVVTALASGDLQFNDGANDIADIAVAVAIIQGGIPLVDVQIMPTFAAKNLPDGRKLFARITGAQFSVVAGNNDCNFSIPFPVMKIDGVEVIGGELGDSVNLHVLDTPTGTLSTIPNYHLNQFGFTTFISKDYYLRQSKYDADLIADMQIRTDYYSVSAKTIYINYLIHEVKV